MYCRFYSFLKIIILREIIGVIKIVRFFDDYKKKTVRYTLIEFCLQFCKSCLGKITA